MKKIESPAPRPARESRTVLDRILDTPHLEHVVPRLQADLLHRVIQSCGLEDCSQLVMLATSEQLTRLFDLDLWRSPQPGMNEQFDADRFGLWVEVLAQLDASIAAQKLAEMDLDVVIAGLAQHSRVFDIAVVTPYKTTDGIDSIETREPDHDLATDIGGYRIFAKRTGSWEAIVSVLIALDAEHPDCFHRVMRGCRALSHSGYELDELDDLLPDEDQTMFDLALDRERRRDKQGYVTPTHARAFLQMSRHLHLESDTAPPANPVVSAYFRSLDQMMTAHTEPRSFSTSTEPVFSASPVEATAALIDVLFKAGIIAPQRARLNPAQDHTAVPSRIRTHMQFVFDCDRGAYARRNAELTYIANTLMAGCALQGRSFTAEEAPDAAIAVCNLGLENWPPQWNGTKSLPGDFLVNHDLVTVFQVGWTVLHKDVAMYAAEQLLTVLSGLRCHEHHIQTELDALHTELSTCCRSGMPWRARRAMDVIAILDLPAWPALLGLIDECPVLHAALRASRDSKLCAVSASAFEFISENSQITTVREFIQSMPETLCP